MAIKGPKKFTKEELQELEEIRVKLSDLSFQLGILQISKINMKKREAYLENELNNLNKVESDLAKKLTDKYGKGNLDLETGEFIPVE